MIFLNLDTCVTFWFPIEAGRITRWRGRGELVSKAAPGKIELILPFLNLFDDHPHRFLFDPRKLKESVSNRVFIGYNQIMSFRGGYFFWTIQVNVAFLYPLKTLENLWFSDVFWGYRKRILVWNGLRVE